jgi:hypothetical protein
MFGNRRDWRYGIDARFRGAASTPRPTVITLSCYSSRNTDAYIRARVNVANRQVDIVEGCFAVRAWPVPNGLRWGHSGNALHFEIAGRPPMPTVPIASSRRSPYLRSTAATVEAAGIAARDAAAEL